MANISELDFTERELDVLYLVSLGMSNKAISKILCISPSTVKAHLTSIYKKLGVENRTVAALWVKDNNITPRPDLKLP